MVISFEREFMTRPVGVPVSLALHGLFFGALTLSGLLAIPEVDPPDVPMVFTPVPVVMIEFGGSPEAGPPPPLRKGDPDGDRQSTVPLQVPRAGKPDSSTPVAEPTRPGDQPQQAQDADAVETDGAESPDGSGRPGYGDPGGDLNGNPYGVPGGTGTKTPGTGGGPEGGGDGGPVYDGEIYRPVLIHRVDPGYPRAARAGRIDGTVSLEIIIGTEGKIIDIRVIHSPSAILEKAAIDAIKQWRYEPARIDNRAVVVYVRVDVTFSLN